jgi:hypothetical protein
LVIAHRYTDILHYSQQDQKNRVSQPIITVFTISHSQETRFFTQVQDSELGLTQRNPVSGHRDFSQII